MTGQENGKRASGRMSTQDNGKKKAQIGLDVSAEDVRRLVAKLKGEDANK